MKRLAVLLVLAGCLPTEATLPGRACDPAHPCGDGLYCLDGRCQEEVPPAGDAAAGSTDAANVDGAEERDGSIPIDGGSTDAGSGGDAAVSPDAGTNGDGGADSGATDDAGAAGDAGGGDAGASDGGPLLDGGGTPDASVGDGGTVIANLLANGSFSGTVEGWAPAEGSQLRLVDSVTRTAPGAVEISAVTSTPVAYLNIHLEQDALPVPRATGGSGKRYCFSAWTRAGSSVSVATLVARQYDDVGATLDTSGSVSGARATLPADGTWVRLFAALTATPPFDAGLTLRIFSPWATDGRFYVDDVTVWLSDDVACSP